MNLFHKADKEFIACLQIFLIHHAPYIALRPAVILLSLFKQRSAVFLNYGKVRINIIIILAIIFVIGG